MMFTPEVALNGSASLLAQLAQPGIDTPEEAALIFSGPQFFIALLSGLVLAFGFQMLLTNLSVAAGVSYLSHQSGNGAGPGAKKISVGFGIWTLITVSLALFFACWLSVRLSLYNSTLLGAITGLVIWGTYFTLLVWVSSTTVGSLIGSVVKSATSSFQTIVGTAAAALGAKAVSNQTIATAEATAAAVRKELTAGFDSEAIKENLQDYLVALRSPEVNVDALEQEFERLIRESDVVGFKDGDNLGKIDRQTFVKLVSARTDLSRREVERVADRLYQAWQRNVNSSSQGGFSELVSYLQSAKPEEMLSQGIGNRIDQLIEELRKRRHQDQSPNVLAQGFNLLTGIIMGRTDISDLDVDKLLQQIKSAKNQVLDQADQLAYQLSGESAQPNMIKADVENYLLNTYAWQLKPARLEAEFRNVLYDPDADATILRQQLEQINRSYFVEILRRRGLMTQAEIQELSIKLDLIYQQVLREVTAAEQILAEKQLRRQVEIFLQLTPKEELFSNMGERAFTALVEDETASNLRERFRVIDREFMVQFLLDRPDIQSDEAQVLTNQYQGILERVAADHESLQAAVRTRLEQQQQKLQDYLRNTDRAELNPEGIQRDLKVLLEEPNEGIQRIRYRLAQFDRDTLTTLLSQRPDFTEADANQLLTEVESNWYALQRAPARVITQAQHQLDEANHAIATYLRNTGKEELNPDGIQRDLQQLIENPKVGAQAIRARMARIDRDTLVQLLSQREDLSEADVNRAIDNLEAGIQSVLKAPRRLARRTQVEVQSFQDALADYLRNTDKAELNPEGIQRDFKLLLEDPRLGMERLNERLTQVDRSTLIALLSQREDISEAEAAKIVDNVLAVRNQIVDQVRNLQMQFDTVINRLFARLRRYLDSLDRPELNYEGMRRDIRTLFNDPQAGFDALRDRLGQFDRDTLIALLSSHDSISQTDAERVVNQIESARDSVLQRAERLEHQVQTQLNTLKQQAQQQFEETRAAAEAAAWWLFGTALISAIVSALGGSLAVTG